MGLGKVHVGGRAKLDVITYTSNDPVMEPVTPKTVEIDLQKQEMRKAWTHTHTPTHTHAGPRITAVCECLNVSSQIMIERLERVTLPDDDTRSVHEWISRHKQLHFGGNKQHECFHK